MARFTTTSLLPDAPPVGVHVAKVVKAREKLSENGNAVLAMTAQFPAGEQLGFAITFVPKAARLVSYFCRSIELELPKEEGVDVEIKPDDVTGRYFFPVVELVGDGLEATPRITKFLSRAEAYAANPSLRDIKLQPQFPRVLKALNEGTL